MEAGDIFKGISIAEDGAIKHLPPASAPLPTAISTQDRLASLLPTATSDLTTAELTTLRVYQEARLVLGSAGAAVMTCAGEHCPIQLTCPLMKIHKAPVGDLCPFEANYIVERFAGWMRELDRTEATMSETDRSSISQLVTMDLQEQRCLQIMSIGKAASMVDVAVKEVDLQTNQPLSYENIVHANMQIIQEIRTARRMLLDDMERSEKARTRKAKWLPGHAGRDLSTRQSVNADKIAEALEVLDQSPEPKQLG